jgi:Mg/Co/Ni transporter MgtE
VPVAEDGRLVGLARAAALVDADPTVAVAAVMEPPVALAAHEPTAKIATLRYHFGDSPIPVIDSDGYLLGTIPQSSATDAV